MLDLSALKNQNLANWIYEIANLCKPGWIHICDGSKEEYDSLAHELCEKQVFIKLNESLRPNSYLCLSDPNDVARVEDRTFICSKNPKDAGPTNHWFDPQEMRKKLQDMFAGCMQGRKMYVIPFCMGPIDSEMSILGIQVTDSAYVVCNMHIMTRMGQKVLDKLNATGNFVPCVHSVGVPLTEGMQDPIWPCREHENKYIVHFPETKEIWSFGSGYGGNALLGKKCLALRIASNIAKNEGWLAEHMLIVKVTNPEGKSKYMAAAFPSACGKTNLAMMQSTLPGWQIHVVGDDIAWLRFKEDGKLYAINPESGFFGVAPGTSIKTNPHAMESLSKNSIFTNVALTKQQDIWWEGLTDEPPKMQINWKRHPWPNQDHELAAHPNARFTAPIQQCPVVDPAFDDPKGVPIEAIIFGGRRDDTIPLVFESYDWAHGVLIGASLSSQKTAAAEGKVGELRHDPFAMLPFCGYNMGDYFSYWLSFQEKPGLHLPKIYGVNWFRKDAEGKYIWPGFGENIRVLKWIFDRVDHAVEAEDTPIGKLPHLQDLDTSNLSLSDESLHNLLSSDQESLQTEVQKLEKYFSTFKDHMPLELKEKLKQLKLSSLS